MFQNCQSCKTRARSKSDIHNAQKLEIGQLEDEEALFHASAGSAPTNRLSIDLHRLCTDSVPTFRLCTDSAPTPYRTCTDSVSTLYRPCTNSVPTLSDSVPTLYRISLKFLLTEFWLVSKRFQRFNTLYFL